MNIPVKVISKVSGRIVESSLTPRKLLDLIDEADLVTEITMCPCQPIGETNFTECNCDEEWDDCELYIGDEVK